MTKLIAVSLMLMMQGSPNTRVCDPRVGCLSLALESSNSAENTLTFVGKDGSPEFTLKAQHVQDGDVKDATLSFDDPTGRIDRLSDVEYARLQKLRQAVADAEKEIAKDHGVDTVGGQRGAFGCTETCPTPKPPDRYEFRGRFLLVNLPEASR